MADGHATPDRVPVLRDALRAAAQIPDRRWSVWEATGRPATMRPQEGEAVITLDEALALWTSGRPRDRD